jgi:hypothetical protein
MIKKALVLGFVLMLIKTASAQYVQVLGNPELDTLVQRNIESNQITNGIQGYRVQIFFGSDRKAANDARTQFLQLYPNTEAYLLYQQPNFKVRVGDFRTQQEAQALFKELLRHFERVFLVPDKINLPKL